MTRPSTHEGRRSTRALPTSTFDDADSPVHRLERAAEILSVGVLRHLGRVDAPANDLGRVSLDSRRQEDRNRWEREGTPWP